LQLIANGWRKGDLNFVRRRNLKPRLAKIVETAFKTFLHEGSLSKAGVSLNSRGYRLPKRRENGNRRARLGHFTIDNLHDILKNPAYMGKRKAVINGQTTLVKAVWEPIVSEELFNRPAQG
jgi:hypothetical protein